MQVLEDAGNRRTLTRNLEDVSWEQSGASGEDQVIPHAVLNGGDEGSLVQTRKSVRFNEPSRSETDKVLTLFRLESEDDEDDEDFQSQSDAPTSDEDSDDDSSETTEDSSLSSSAASTSSSDESSDEDSSASEPEEVSARLPPGKTNGVRPGSGSRTTHDRNKRKKESSRLNGLKKAGLLPPNASLEDLRNWVTSSSGRGGQKADQSATSFETLVGDTHPTATRGKQSEAVSATDKVSVLKKNISSIEIQKQRQELIDAIASGGVDVTPVPQTKKPAASATSKHSAISVPKERRLKMLEDIVSGGPENDSMETEPSTSALSNIPIEDAVNKSSTISVAIPPNSDSLAQKTAAEPPQKRARLDVAGSRRMLFGSLGLRNPKTKADEERTRAKIMENATRPRSNKASIPAEGPSAEQAQEPEDPDFWKSKIVITAVECCDEGVELGAPPFPFVQRWHGQKQNQHQNSSAGSKKRKRANKKFYNDQYEDNYDWYDDSAVQEEAGVALNYDDAVEDPAQSQLIHDMESAAASKAESEDLPSLPVDVSELPNLTMADIKPGIVVTFKQLEMSQATNWAPTISSWRTATVEECAVETLTIRLALRDRPRKIIRYDDKGNRLYDKFEMEDFDVEDGSEDDGIRQILFSELIEPKIVQGAPNTAKGDEDAAPGTEQSEIMDDMQDVSAYSAWEGIEEESAPAMDVADRSGDAVVEGHGALIEASA